MSSRRIFFDVQARASQLPPQRDLLLTMHPFTAYGKSASSREMDLKALGCHRFCFHVEPTQPPGDVAQKRRFCTLAEVSV